MSDDDCKPQTQRSQPKEGEPVEIPVPTRRKFFGNLAKVAPPVEPPAKVDKPDDAS